MYAQATYLIGKKNKSKDGGRKWEEEKEEEKKEINKENKKRTCHFAFS